MRSDLYTKIAPAALRIFDTFGKTTIATLSPRERTSLAGSAMSQDRTSWGEVPGCRE